MSETLKPKTETESLGSTLESAVELPDLSELSKEDFEKLRHHPFFKNFEEGMWLFYKENIGDGKTEEEQKKDFEKLCVEDVKDNTEYLLKNGELKDFQKFLGKKKEVLKEPIEVEGLKDDVLPKKAEVKPETKPEAKDWKEVKRASEVFIIGDLHGNIEALEGNLEHLGLIKNEGGLLEWTGGKARVVFEGDILGDRNINGLNILYKIGRLKEQAEKAGGEIEIIAGNHDDFAISFLMGVEGAGDADGFETCRQGGYVGLLEFSRYGSEALRQSLGKALTFQGKGLPNTWSKRNLEAWNDLNKIKLDHPAWQMLKAEREQILENMRKDPKGRKILEVICDMKLATKKDDTLIIHTNPTKEIVEYLQSEKSVDQTIEFVNKWYSGTLRKVLLDGGKEKPEFMSIKGLFLNTDNREDFTNAYLYDSSDIKKGEKIVKDIADKFKANGINALTHGHSDESNRVRGAGVNFPVISVDFSAFKGKGKLKERSVLKIATDGKMNIGKDMTEIRG